LPALAYQTWLKYKGTKRFTDVTKKFIKQWRKLKPGARRARHLHTTVDGLTADFISEMSVPELIQCKKSCSACCHTQVAATIEEAQQLHEWIQAGNTIDQKRLLLQSAYSRDWYQLSFEQRACVFLDEKNECRVYDRRPSVCRTNFSLSPPSTCDTRDGVVKPQRMLMIEDAHLVIAAAFAESEQAGVLPELLSELEKRSSKLPNPCILR
jgi:uncharacterized protein